MKKSIWLFLVLLVCFLLCLTACKNGDEEAKNNSGEYSYSNGLNFFYDHLEDSCRLTNIGDCTDLEIKIPPISPDGHVVKHIPLGAFSNAGNVTSITIPKGVVKIDDKVFSKCSNLVNIIVNEKNQNYKSIDGILYTKDGKTLLRYPAAKTATEFTIPDGVEEIKPEAFKGCKTLTKITVPEGVRIIGERAFEDCIGLKAITFPDSLTSVGEEVLNNTYFFNRPTNWSSGSLYVGKCLVDIKDAVYDEYTVKDGTVVIADSAMYSCNTKKVILPQSLEHIGNNALACSDITEIVMSENLKTIGSSAFNNCKDLTSIVIPSGVTSIGSGAFYRSAIQSISIGASLESIGEDAFEGCNRLKDVYIFNVDRWCEINFANDYSNPLTLADNLYVNDVLVTEIVIGDEATYISDYAFQSCEWITRVKIGKNVSHIGLFALFNLNLESISVDTLNEHYRSIDGNLYSYDGKRFILCAQAKSGHVIIPEGVTTIAEQAFRNCKNITGITLPQSLKVIEDFAFSGCLKLSEIELPGGLTEIGGYAFASCGLTDVVIPSGVKEISQSAFAFCASLKNVTIEEGVTKVGYQAFINCVSIKEIVIPDSVVYIGTSAFEGCEGLTKITIPFIGNEKGGSGYRNIKSIFDSTGDTVPRSLTTIVLSKEVSSIPQKAFYDCSRYITTIVIPDTVTSIGKDAFSGWCNVENIFYTGTQLQWNRISGIDNIPSDITVTYNYTP